MKKCLTAFALCIIAGLASAQVESVNIVGYSTTTLPKNTFTSMGAQFQVVGGGVAETNLYVKSLVSVSNPRTGSSAVNTVDQIYVWNGSGWTIYFNKTGVGWVSDGAATNETSDTISIGTGYLFRKANYTSGGDATASGQVFMGDSISVNLPKNAFTFVSYPWPVTFAISNFVSAISNPRTGSSALSTVDQLYVWNGSGWTTYFNKTGVGYVTNAIETSVTSDVLPVQGSVLIRKANYTSGGTLTLVKPSSL